MKLSPYLSIFGSLILAFISGLFFSSASLAEQMFDLSGTDDPIAVNVPIDPVITSTMEPIATVLAPTATETVVPPTATPDFAFRDLPEAYLVSMVIRQDGTPEILIVESYNDLRIGDHVDGDNLIELLDREGNVLYKKSFAVSFYTTGEKSRTVSEVKYFMILPAIEGGYSIRLTNSNGEALYELK